MRQRRPPIEKSLLVPTWPTGRSPSRVPLPQSEAKVLKRLIDTLNFHRNHRGPQRRSCRHEGHDLLEVASFQRFVLQRPGARLLRIRTLNGLSSAVAGRYPPATTSSSLSLIAVFGRA